MGNKFAITLELSCGDIKLSMNMIIINWSSDAVYKFRQKNEGKAIFKHLSCTIFVSN